MATTQNDCWGSQPLPLGWEAKYDAAQRRFYYINHATRTTTWDDPRQLAGEQATNQKHQNQQQHYGNSSGSGYSGHSGSTPQKSPTKKPINDFVQLSYNNWEKHVEDKYGLKVQHIKDDEEETSFSNQTSPVLDHNAFTKLKQVYPSVDAEVIKDVLRGVNNDQMRASQQLNALGFSPTRTPPRHDDSSPQRSFQNPKQETLKPHKYPAPAPPSRPTESQKAKLRQKLTKEFPHCAAQVVLMALDSSQYDEAKTRILLKTTRRSSEQFSRESSPTKMYSKDSPKMTQTIPIYATINKPSATTVEATPVGHVQQSNHHASGSNLSSVSETSSSRKEHISKKSAVDQRKMPKTIKPKTEPKAEGEYMSKYRTKPVGANPEIWKGPNLQNILNDYVKVNGPNPANQKGPSGAKGSNPSLRVGPNRNLLSSCQSLALGSRSALTSNALISSLQIT